MNRDEVLKDLEAGYESTGSDILLQMHTAVQSLYEEQDALNADIERLRCALWKLIEAADNSDDARYGTLSTNFVRDIARAAIASKETCNE